MSFSLARDATGRLRAIWRLLAFVVLFVVAIVLLLIPIELLESRGRIDSLVRRMLESIAFALAAVAATWFMLRRVERRDWAMVMLDRSALDRRQLARGALMGLLPIAIPGAILYAIGWLTRVPSEAGSWALAAIGLTITLLPAAFAEEALTRGYPFAVLRESIGRTAAIGLTALVFGVLHGLNPGANAQSIGAVVLAGVFLAVLLLATGSLYAASLGHAAWNWLMAVVLHTPVSGLALPAPDYRIIDSGPDWATGGPWGPESGLPAAAAMILLIIYMLRSHGNRYPFTFKRSVASAAAAGTVPSEHTNG